MDKNQPPQINKRVAVICGSLLFLGGILLGWAILAIAPISAFWPGLIVGFCFTLFLFHLFIKNSKQKKVKDNTKRELSSNMGGIGAGLGVLILAILRGHDAFMVNIAGAAIAMLLGIGIFGIVMVLRKKVKTEFVA